LPFAFSIGSNSAYNSTVQTLFILVGQTYNSVFQFLRLTPSVPRWTMLHLEKPLL